MIKLIEVMRGFAEGSRFDWLHTTHGPFPDFAAIYEYDNSEFEVLVWDSSDSFVSILYGPNWCHGGYPGSYRWWLARVGRNIISCSPHKGSTVHIELDARPIIKQVAVASIHVHVITEPHPEGWE